MSESAKPAAARPPNPFAAFLRKAVVRGYALLILVIVLWAGYMAIAYLSRYVFAATRVPEDYLDPLAQGMPATQPAADGAVQPIAEPQIRHYHRDSQAFAFAGSAGCTTSGCHTLLPHNQRVEVRAFANFHSTFLDCAACHDTSLQGPTKAVWLNDRTQRPQDTPALLRLATVLETRAAEIQTTPGAIAPIVIALLREAESNVGVDPPLHDLLVQLDTSEPGSPVWRQAMGELVAVLPARMRGEYGARITPAGVANAFAQRQRHLTGLAARYHAAPAGSATRSTLQTQIHEHVLAKPDACLSCHRDQPSRFDFEALGYSPQRAAALRDAPIARMIEQIRQGQPFHLPQLLDRP